MPRDIWLFHDKGGSSKCWHQANFKQQTHFWRRYKAGYHAACCRPTHNNAHRNTPRSSFGASLFSHCVYWYAPKFKILPDSALPSSLWRNVFFRSPCESIGRVMRRQVKHIFSLKYVVSCSCVHPLDLKLGRLSGGDVPEPRPHQSLKRGVNTSENLKHNTLHNLL